MKYFLWAVFLISIFMVPGAATTARAESADAFYSQVQDTADSIFVTALDFLTGDAKETERIFENAGRQITSTKQFTVDNFWWWLGTIVFLGAGVLGFAGFSANLIFKAFEQDFMWGGILLADGLILFAPVFKGATGAFFVLPYFLSAYFVVRYWEDVRSAVVGQLFSLNVATLGYIMLRGVFS